MNNISWTQPGSNRRVLVTGSEGLIGSLAMRVLWSRGFEPVGLDLRASGAAHGDTRDAVRMREALQGVCGVIHLAAVSRVIDGQRDPEKCWNTNVQALEGLLAALKAQDQKPWLVFASSREVYGHTDGRPTSEDAALKPVNIYGESKLEGERLVAQAREWGLRSCIVRFSNVYGSTDDHADRVVPAFALAGVLGRAMRVDGNGNTFDFTHVTDSVSGLVALVQRLAADSASVFPPIHFVTGHATSLAQLSALAVELGGHASAIVEAPSRSFDVAHFRGDPARGLALLGWQPKVLLRDGLSALMHDFAAREAAQPGAALAQH